MEYCRLDIIEFKNRRWLFLINIPIVFGLFIITFLISFVISNNESKIDFFLTFIIFLIEIQLITIILSKFRFKSNGKLVFDGNGIYIITSFDTSKIPWENISEIKFYYRGDKLWQTKIGTIKINHGRYRYNNLHYGLTNDMDEKKLIKLILMERLNTLRSETKKRKHYFLNFYLWRRKKIEILN